jgi:two-component system nitrogen regulation response regulator GlnG
MAASQQITAQDLPPELQTPLPISVQSTAQSIAQATVQAQTSPQSQHIEVQALPLLPPAQGATDWQTIVYQETLSRLQVGENNVIDTLYEQLETVCINAALEFTKGHKSEAAQRLGLGRNTLARKAKK